MDNYSYANKLLGLLCMHAERLGDRKPVITPTIKVQKFLKNCKDRRQQPDTPDMYKIPCECHHVYRGTSKLSIKARLVELEKQCSI